MTTHEQIPSFLAEMPEAARASYLNPSIVPKPLPSGLARVMPWRGELLPAVLQEYVRDVAERTQCPPDFVGVALVVAVSAVVGRKFTIHPKQHDDWTVVPNQWGVIIGRPSAMKTPALKQALRPLDALETRERNRHSMALEDYRTNSELLDIERKAAKSKATKLIGSGDKPGAREELTKVSSDVLPPVQRRYTVNDSTVEKLGELLNENPNGLLLVRDELGGWLATIQSEDGSVARAFYLECFDGNGSFTYDRIGRGTLFIESCCLSLIGGIQPSRIASLVNAAISGEVDDGLIQRLQLAVYPDDIREWRLIDRWPNQAAAEHVEQIINHLDQLPSEPRAALRFSPEAQEIFNAWYTHHMQQSRSEELHPALQSHYLKMPQTIAGLALLFELVEGGQKAVGTESTSRAINWASYLMSHALRLYGAAINAPLLGARLILERQQKLPEPFTPREVRQKDWMGLGSQDAVNNALAVLAEHDLIIGYEVAGEKGGRPSTRYIWRKT
ncbi:MULTISPECIES: YfjI family protein [Pseudomonas]|uniref:YfjI family protein n=1 Tax=Pseudomonas guariconensis TaxID=1288410 RepID=UPI002096BFB6|nr:MULTISPECIES: YfjI family protein [Pseudomonas]MCO7596612.1 YfjI family protein [Pseudomonas guariconensis]MCU7222491.1 YfjI family protein [Pseudomonas brassicacearum]